MKLIRNIIRRVAQVTKVRSYRKRRRELEVVSVILAVKEQGCLSLYTPTLKLV